MAEIITVPDSLLNDFDRCFSTKRRNSKGISEPVETTFDHALTALKLYELTGESKYLEAGIGYFHETANETGRFIRWNFSTQVEDIPPDADTTTLSLLFFTMAERSGLDFPKNFSASRNLRQFEEFVDESGGIQTYLGNKANNNVDPVVNSGIAFLYLLTNNSNEVFNGIKKYLNRCLRSLAPNSQISQYYVGGVYFAARMAKLTAYDGELLDEEATQRLDYFLLNTVPRNTLEATLASIGSSHRGLYRRARELNDDIRRKRRGNGLWPYGTLYRQRTPRFSFGTERLTTLFALEALKLEVEGPKILR